MTPVRFGGIFAQRHRPQGNRLRLVVLQRTGWLFRNEVVTKKIRAPEACSRAEIITSSKSLSEQRKYTRFIVAREIHRMQLSYDLTIGNAIAMLWFPARPVLAQHRAAIPNRHHSCPWSQITKHSSGDAVGVAFVRRTYCYQRRTPTGNTVTATGRSRRPSSSSAVTTGAGPDRSTMSTQRSAGALDHARPCLQSRCSSSPQSPLVLAASRRR